MSADTLRVFQVLAEGLQAALAEAQVSEQEGSDEAI